MADPSSNIDDSKFQSTLKQKKSMHKKNVKEVLNKASKVLLKGDEEISLQLS